MTNTSVCLATGCDRKAVKRGLCSTHYSRLRRQGREFPTDGPIPDPQQPGSWRRGMPAHTRRDPESVTLDTLLANTRTDQHGCMIWQGRLNQGNGYADSLMFSGRQITPHRLAAILSYGYTTAEAFDVPSNIVTRHLCHVRACICPDHLVMGSVKQNSADMVAAGRWRGRQQWASGTCQRGHDVTDPANVYVAPNGDRACRACQAEHHRRRWNAKHAHA